MHTPVIVTTLARVAGRDIIAFDGFTFRGVELGRLFEVTGTSPPKVFTDAGRAMAHAFALANHEAEDRP